MVILKAEVLKEWLKTTRKNQMWLAEMYDVRPSYISQILNNRTHISGNFIGFVLTLTHMEFKDLFYYDAAHDTRNFFGKDIFWEGQKLTGKNYYKLVQAKLNRSKDIDRPKELVYER